MGQEARSLPWVTPAKYVGPAMVITFLVGAAVAAMFVTSERFNEAIVTLLITMCLLLVGIADLLGELIMVSTSRAQAPGA